MKKRTLKLEQSHHYSRHNFLSKSFSFINIFSCNFKEVFYLVLYYIKVFFSFGYTVHVSNRLYIMSSNLRIILLIKKVFCKQANSDLTASNENSFCHCIGKAASKFEILLLYVIIVCPQIKPNAKIVNRALF